jgi:c(7)-type cytochrome triheme protein
MLAKISNPRTVVVLRWLMALLALDPSFALPFYGDIQMNRTTKRYGVPPVVFPHWAHRVQFTCQVCHPAIFQMRVGVHEIFMERMAAHETFCLSCHNGKVAWKPVNCARCHRGKEEVPLAENKNSVKLPTPGPPFAKENSNPEVLLKDFPRDFEGGVNWIAAVKQGLISPFLSLTPRRTQETPTPPDILMSRTDTMPAVVFPHASHALWLDCQNCHPVIFTARKAANPVSMAKLWAGQYCGVCHGKVAFSLSQCTRCHSQ